MDKMNIQYRDDRDFGMADVLDLYQANEWPSANKPDALYNALMNSHSVVTTWDENKLVGLGNAISDGHLTVYYPHLLVMPDYQGKGVGKTLLETLTAKYEHFHQHVLFAMAHATEFYLKCGFKKADKIDPMWIYKEDVDRHP